MTVAIYVQDMRASGVVRTMMAMARSFQASGDTVLLAGYAAGLFGAGDVAPARFVAAAEQPRGRFPRLAVAWRLRRALRDLAPAAVLSGGNFGHFSLWLATRGLGLPIVWVFSNAMVRAGQPWRNRWRRVWTGLLMLGGARAILVSGDLARSALFRRHLANGRAVLIPNGIDLAAVPPADGLAPDALAGPDPVILSIGRLQPQKNFEGLIDAVAVARQTRPVRLVVLGAGSDEYRAALLARAAARGIAAHVLFAGTTANVYPWLRNAAVFALASHWEGSSIALLEAMAAGTPIVASRSAGDAADVLDGGRYGLVADGADPHAFAAALLRQIAAPVRPGTRVRDYDAGAVMRAYHRVLTAAAAPAGRAPPLPPPPRRV